MDYRLEPVSVEDGDQIIDIFNYYVENSFAAYPESKDPNEFFQAFLNLTQSYPFLVAKDMSDKVIGFGSLRPYSPLTTFSRTSEITNSSLRSTPALESASIFWTAFLTGLENGDRHHPGKYIFPQPGQPGLPQEETVLCSVDVL